MMCNERDSSNFEMCDEEKSFHQWMKKNIPYVNSHKASISVMRKLYMDGFAAGFIHQRTIKAEEELQKMSPMYKAEDWSGEFDMTLKYEPMNEGTINTILSKYKNDDVLEYIKQLWNLIDYQRKLIWEQRKEIIAVKHKKAWVRYDKELDHTDSKNRLDKPQRTDNMGC